MFLFGSWNYVHPVHKNKVFISILLWGLNVLVVFATYGIFQKHQYLSELLFNVCVCFIRFVY